MFLGSKLSSPVFPIKNWMNDWSLRSSLGVSPSALPAYPWERKWNPPCDMKHSACSIFAGFCKTVVLWAPRCSYSCCIYRSMRLTWSLVWQSPLWLHSMLCYSTVEEGPDKPFSCDLGISYFKKHLIDSSKLSARSWLAAVASSLRSPALLCPHLSSILGSSLSLSIFCLSCLLLSYVMTCFLLQVSVFDFFWSLPPVS